LRSWSLCNILSDERMGLSFTVAGGPRQRSHSPVRVPRDSWPHFTVPDLRHPQFEGSCPRIYIPHEQGGLVMPPGTGFPFRCLLWLAGLWWRFSTLPPHGLPDLSWWALLYSLGTDCIENTASHGSSIVVCISVYLANA
jgi:hypothetical protein